MERSSQSTPKLNSLKQRARECGHLAREGARKLKILLGRMHDHPDQWSAEQAVALSRQVDYRLRQAHAIGQIIDEHEKKLRLPTPTGDS